MPFRLHIRRSGGQDFAAICKGWERMVRRVKQWPGTAVRLQSLCKFLGECALSRWRVAGTAGV
jgi:hypothetical protein